MRDATEKELADRKVDIKQRQNDDLRERQHDACDAVRQVRDVQYQELLQRQRDEPAAPNSNAFQQDHYERLMKLASVRDTVPVL